MKPLPVSIPCTSRFTPCSGTSATCALNYIAKLIRHTKTQVRLQSLKPNEFIIAKVPHQSIEIEIRGINYRQQLCRTCGVWVTSYGKFE